MSTTIPFRPSQTLSAATLTALVRLDTDLSVTLPSPATFTYDADSDLWEIEADLPAGIEVYWEADGTKSGGGAWATDGVIVGGDEDDALSGTYWTWDGIRNILGQINAEVASQLDSDSQSLETDRVAADGDLADAYTNRRARLAGHDVPLTAETTDDFALVRFVTNLYAAYLLVSHREWFADLSDDAREKAALSLEGRAMALYDALFGPDPTGIDGPEEEAEGTWLDQLRDIKPAPGRTRTACGVAKLYDTEGNPYPVGLNGWYADPYYLSYN